jgi:predicted TIM-barrel fold metal-dependent hydrolase
VLDGKLLVDAHVHIPRLPTLKPAWLAWAERFGPPGLLEQMYDADGTARPAELDAHFAEQGVDVALLFSEYSPKVTGIQPIEDLVPIAAQNPHRFKLVANINPHLHYPVAAELERQLDLGAVALKIHPVHGGFAPSDPAMYPAYEVCRARGIPVVMHCGTSTFPGSSNKYADPLLLDDALRDFPQVQFVLAHGGRGWWYDPAAFMALSRDNVWIELAGLPPRRLPEYYARFDLVRLAQRWIFATDWPGVPGSAHNARAVAALGLPDDVVALVWGENARRVYPLGD